MKSICFFSSYFNESDIPVYVKFYLDNLLPHFTKIIFLTNEKQLDVESNEYLIRNAMEPFYITNEGYDFGMWYKALMKYDLSGYYRIGLINDSCILFKPLDEYFLWLNNQDLDFSGIIDSSQYNYHIQSFFTIINKNAISYTLNYFKKNGLQSNRKNVIKVYELGWSSYIQSKGLKMGAFFSYKKYHGVGNPSVYGITELIRDGFPLIKKKIIFRTFSKAEFIDILKHPFRHDPNYYFRIIREANEKENIFNFKLLSQDGYKRNQIEIVFSFFTSLLFRLARFLLGPSWRYYKKTILKREE